MRSSTVRRLAVAVFALGSISGAGVVRAQTVTDIVITRGGAGQARLAPHEYFTGVARIYPLFEAQAIGEARPSGGIVSFDAGARTAWHMHPRGQTLIVTAGVGRVQLWGGSAQEIRPGDVVWIPPGVKHWHGAAPTTAMTHVALAEALDGQAVRWMEQVSDVQYRAPTQTHHPALTFPTAATAVDKLVIAPADFRFDVWEP